MGLWTFLITKKEKQPEPNRCDPDWNDQRMRWVTHLHATLADEKPDFVAASDERNDAIISDRTAPRQVDVFQIRTPLTARRQTVRQRDGVPRKFPPHFPPPTHLRHLRDMLVTLEHDPRSRWTSFGLWRPRLWQVLKQKQEARSESSDGTDVQCRYSELRMHSHICDFFAIIEVEVLNVMTLWGKRPGRERF